MNGEATIISEFGEVPQACETFLDSHEILDVGFRKEFLERELGFCYHIARQVSLILDQIGNSSPVLILWDIDGVIAQTLATYVRPSFAVLAEAIRRTYPEILYGFLTATCPKNRISTEGDLHGIGSLFDNRYCFSSEFQYLFGPALRHCSGCPVLCGEFYGEGEEYDPNSRCWQDALNMQKIEGYKKEVADVLSRPTSGVLSKVAVLRFLLEDKRIPAKIPLIWVDDILSSDSHVPWLEDSKKKGEMSPIPRTLHFVSNEMRTPLSLPNKKRD